MRVFQEEIFGPVLVAMPFDDEADAIRLANATPYGLAAYVWTNDIRRAHRVAHAIDTGMCWINSRTCAICAPRSAASRPPGSAARAATTRSTSTATSRSSTSRSGRTRFPAWGCGDDA